MAYSIFITLFSLYPSVNKYAKYPVGHPVIITCNFKDLSHYFGLAKVKVLPPRKLFHPVLPYTTDDGKLKFPLCKRCADIECQDKCNCTDEERTIVGTWCTPELDLALSKGYTILKFYEVYHFKDTSEYNRETGTGGLFTGYVNLFLKLKQQASGFPHGCESEAQKLEYIAKYADHEHIQLDYHQIKKNPGLRTLAKICLNSFWGKFGQRLNMNQTTFLYETEAYKFFQLLTDPEKEISDFHIVSDDIIQLEYTNSSSFLPPDFKTNVFLASFTTCNARLKLYSLLEICQKNTLYLDTDSIIFYNNHSTITSKLPIGNYLGELTNEISPDDGHITKFVSSGPKSYAYTTQSQKQVCKVRGFSLESKMNSDLINFSSMQEIVVAKTKDIIKTTNPRKISRLAKKRTIYNRIEEKEFRMVYTKRRLLSDLTTLPFGYTE